MIKKTILMVFAVLSVFGAERSQFEPGGEDPQRNEVKTTIIRNESGTYLNIVIDALAKHLDQSIEVSFGITDINGDQHVLYEREFGVEELLALQNQRGRIQVDMIVPLDDDLKNDLVASLSAEGLLKRDEAFVVGKRAPAGSFTANARAWQYYIWKVDQLVTCAEGRFSCTGCTIIQGNVGACVASNCSYDSSGNSLYAKECVSDIEFTAYAFVDITRAEWTPSGELVNYWLYDSL